MFPSGDPFAYPIQPLMNYRVAGPPSHSEAQPSHMPVTGGPSHADSRNFYMPSMYGDIEGHLSKCYKKTNLVSVLPLTPPMTPNTHGSRNNWR